MTDDIIETFHFLSSIPQPGRGELLARSVRKKLKRKDVLVRDGNECSYLPLVLDGSLRVYKSSENGRELTLYRIERGESCILSASCMLNGGSFPAVAEADGDVDVLMVPAKLLLKLVADNMQWQRFLVDQYARRLEVTLTLVEEVAFHHMDVRLAALLLKEAGAQGIVNATHAGLASDLGTSREVVTRLLKDFESGGIIATNRGRIRILLPDDLGRRASLASGV
jgi:CRP/FNR family transcriptional regulator, anaerobic regulatory protein